MTTLYRDRMGNYLPRYYSDSRIVDNLLDRESEEMNSFGSYTQDIVNQNFVDTATWGLSRWEEILGLPIGDSKTYEERRAYIKSTLRGNGTTTAALIQSVAESFDGGVVTVTEQNNLYQFTVNFISTLGVPTNIADLEAVINAIKPAHLAVVFNYNYFLFSELDTLNKTFTQFDALNLNWNQLEVYG